jgi:AcrR family transcriptional regulator
LELKERILKTADDICRKIGFRSMTMDDLALKLGISKKTLYQYYADKEAIVDAIINDEIISCQQDCSICSDIAVDAVDEIFLTLEMIHKISKI